ncbi:TonB-dependent receptor [Paraurantiacibacter namhicola]|uniref:Putative TonB-dependent receptor BfrD n=1 Tax=Paraurantiacibacter namhicola TaxID=645517 RepID=A0A1C7DBG3_9SPHN|nr:TonB-dependent siderophore receptor [Paraurantiacibacter namhicola]ANU08757.1 putative TonB-dependent receptor BfrD precursor [Paraurantiacibacter namhicola]
MSAFSKSLRVAAFTTAACIPQVALANIEVDADRDYLPTEIVVTGSLDGYSEDDGSTGTKTPTPLVDVPQTIAVIGQDQIEDQNLRQLGEALRYVPGISIETGEGHRDAVFIRGQETTADFYIDGIRDDAQYYRPLYNVERVEVLKGPNALIFGRGAGGGAINRVAKIADPYGLTLAGNASVDSFGGFAFAADVGTPLAEGIGLRLNATYEQFDGARDVFEGEFFGIAPTLTAEFGDTQVSAFYVHDEDDRVTDRGLPSLGTGPIQGYDKTFFGDPDYNRATANVDIARLRVDHKLSDAVSINGTLQYADYDKYYGNIVPTGATATTVTLSGYDNSTDRQNLIGQANLVAEFQTGEVGHTLLLGVEAMGQESIDGRNRVLFAGGATSTTVPLGRTISVPAFTTTFQRERNSDLTTLSFYAQEQLDFGPLQLIAGVRYDRFELDTFDVGSSTALSRTDEKWSPRVGLVFEPLEHVSLYASYSQSFLPQSGDQFTVLSSTTALLEPESFDNYEIGVKWAPRPNLLITGAAFRLDRSNTQATDPLNPGAVVLTGASRVQGIELSVTGRLTDNFDISGGYTYLDGEVREDTTSAVAGTRLEQLPEHQVSLWGRYKLTDRLAIGTGVIHQSSQLVPIGGPVRLPAYTRVDAGLFYDATDTIAVQLNVENLLDEDYYPAAHGPNNIQPGDPLNATLTVRMKL